MINLNSEEVRQNPFPAYEEVRRIGAAVYDSKRNMMYQESCAIMNVFQTGKPVLSRHCMVQTGRFIHVSGTLFSQHSQQNVLLTWVQLFSRSLMI